MAAVKKGGLGKGLDSLIPEKPSKLKEENNIKADMLKFRKGDGSVKRAITKSQFHFGYAYLPINKNVE